MNKHISKNKHVLNGITKFIKIKTSNEIKFLSCKNYKNELSRPCDLFVILFNDTKQIRDKIKLQFSNIVPLYAVFDDSYLIITKLLGKQINEWPEICTPSAIAQIYISKIGAILKTQKSSFKLLGDYRDTLHPKIWQVDAKDTKNIIPNNHGWLSVNTRLCLRFMLQTASDTFLEKGYKNSKAAKHLVIVELGSWLGSSTCEMLTSINAGSLYCFDRFQNIALTDYDFKESDPLDLFWRTVPRYETFCRNIAPYLSSNKKVYTITYDVLNSVNVLKSNGIMPDIVFIDAIKSRNKLLQYLSALFLYAPSVIVIGDDYVFPTVKDAIREFMQRNMNYAIFTTDDCYILAKDEAFKKYGIRDQTDLVDQASKFIAEQIDADYIKKIVFNLFAKKYDIVCDLLKNHDIDINIPLSEFNNNTFYTLVIIEIYSKLVKDAESVQKFILDEIDQHPEKIKNSLFLTWQDYIDHKIVF
jgi:hypothetical protein